MKFINIAEQQLRTDISSEQILLTYQDFFEEYFSIFEERSQFQEDINSILSRIGKQQTIANTEKLREHLSNLVPFTSSIADDIVSPDIIFFIGLGSWDGHGIILNGRPFTFFDMTRMNIWMANPSFRLKAHLVHEVLHAIHYYHSQEFYPENYESVGDYYIKKMMAEGVATYLASCVTKVSLDEALWLGLLDKPSVKKWVKKCEESKKSIWYSIKKVIRNNREDEHLLEKLFSVPGITSDMLIEGRLGYYYGAQIAKRAAKDLGELKILYLDPTKFKKYLKFYFEED